MQKKASQHFWKKENQAGKTNKKYSMEDKFIKEILSSSKTIAMIGVSSVKKDDPLNIKRRPSVIVMKYLQEFGYQVIPVNPFAAGKKINGENVVAQLEDIAVPIDIVDVFRPSVETPKITQETIKVGAKSIWLQYGIHNEEAEVIAKKANINYVSNKCIKQEYQRLFLKMNPVFPMLKNN
jgi:predicted CoA-binding protein